MSNSGNNDNEGETQRALYRKLYHLAEAALSNESPGHSLQATLLTNDAYLRLLEQKNVDTGNRTQTMAAGAVIIRRLLIDYARRRKAKKRGGGQGRGKPLQDCVPDQAAKLGILELNDALEVLAEKNTRAAQVVELKYFGGLNSTEIAEQLGVSLRTVNSDWIFAKAWLKNTLGAEQENLQAEE